MNYRHAFHAGNRGDVVKHAVLMRLLVSLRQKVKPFFVLDSHGGAGWYDLDDAAARRTGEASAGIDRVMAAPDSAATPLLADYLQAVAACRAETGRPRAYPGSPWLIRSLLRSHDRLAVCEWHPEEAARLRRQLSSDPRVGIHHRDGYEGVKGLLPPAERRGLVLIDPPYEHTEETARIARALSQGYRRFTTGLFAVWYPIKERPAVWRLQDAVVATGIRRVLRTELSWSGQEDRLRFTGCGLMLVNPPWRVAQELPDLLDLLHRALKTEDGGVSVDWLVQE